MSATQPELMKAMALLHLLTHLHALYCAHEHTRTSDKGVMLLGDSGKALLLSLQRVMASAA